MNIMIYNEGVHEAEPEVAAVYPQGIHGALAAALQAPEHTITITTLADVEQKITPETLAQTDVLLWWGHMSHKDVPDAVAETVHNAVLCGMGFIALHSGHFSKPFRRIMGTSGALNWYEYCRERLWVVAPAHPIAAGLPA
ncbi:MAG: ThuA domain-containing protein, partial [Clostridia bacterium]|nr:ThuA domain-containing protein [Clostridia bacterium]